jgi:hypothetical protein
MPAYNAARTLVQTVEEIPAGFVDEIIVVDDEDAQLGCHNIYKKSPCAPRPFVILCPLIQGTVTHVFRLLTFPHRTNGLSFDVTSRL